MRVRNARDELQFAERPHRSRAKDKAGDKTRDKTRDKTGQTKATRRPFQWPLSLGSARQDYLMRLRLNEDRVAALPATAQRYRLGRPRRRRRRLWASKKTARSRLERSLPRNVRRGRRKQKGWKIPGKEDTNGINPRIQYPCSSVFNYTHGRNRKERESEIILSSEFFAL